MHAANREYLIMRDDLILGFLYLHQFAEFSRPAGLTFANDLRVRLKQADQLSRKLGQAVEDSRLGLPHHLAHAIGQGFQTFAQGAHNTAAASRQRLDFLQRSNRTNRRYIIKSENGGKSLFICKQLLCSNITVFGRDIDALELRDKSLVNWYSSFICRLGNCFPPHF